jgi:hypothetical protein
VRAPSQKAVHLVNPFPILKVKEELEEIRDLIYASGYTGVPDTVLDEVSAESEAAERFLIDTFQLLISFISVLYLVPES